LLHNVSGGSLAEGQEKKEYMLFHEM